MALGDRFDTDHAWAYRMVKLYRLEFPEKAGCDDADHFDAWLAEKERNAPLMRRLEAEIRRQEPDVAMIRRTMPEWLDAMAEARDEQLCGLSKGNAGDEG